MGWECFFLIVKDYFLSLEAMIDMIDPARASIVEYLKHSDLGVMGIARKAKVDANKFRKYIKGRESLTSEESLAIETAIKEDSKTPSRKELARKRKMRKALALTSKVAQRNAAREAEALNALKQKAETIG